MAEQASRLMTLAEFLKWDDGTETHYELIDGQVFAMSPPAEAHGVIAASLSRLISAALIPPCRVVSQAAVTLPNNDRTCYEADLAVTCVPHQRGRKVPLDPVLIVEVLSPSTAQHDRTTKVNDYRQIPSVAEILLVSSEARTASLYRRDGPRWLVEDFVGNAAFELRSAGCRIELAEVYQGLDL